MPNTDAEFELTLSLVEPPPRDESLEGGRECSAVVRACARMPHCTFAKVNAGRTFGTPLGVGLGLWR